MTDPRRKYPPPNKKCPKVVENGTEWQAVKCTTGVFPFLRITEMHGAAEEYGPQRIPKTRRHVQNMFTVSPGVGITLFHEKWGVFVPSGCLL